MLITGGAGFIGSHLTRHLLSQGHRVHLLDNLSTGRRANVAPLLNDQCTLQVQSVGEAFEHLAWLREFDVIYHLAAAVGVQLIVDDPVRTIETNVLETARVLQGAAAFGIPVLITSSSEVYGKSAKVPFSEDDDVTYGATIYSRWSYAATKALDEYLGLAYAKEYGLGVVIVRLFNTVGPGQLGQYGMVLPRFIEWAIDNKPIDIYGDGRQSRCFSHVQDVVEAFPKLLAEPACHGRVYNLGSDQEVTIDALADRVIALTGSTAGKRYIPYEKAYGQAFDDLRRRVPDLKRIREAIGFEPRRKLDQILTEWIEQARHARR
ncbi:MAG: NAD-dependent epimerase/dehydratase family protein [Planctomycetes bacterium]|nr:NAD-dependent epimerase/dehydratase family protein [Planctomycetota bacterium]